MIKINKKSQFTYKFLKKLLENGFDFMKEKELKVYILYLLLEGGQFVNTDENIDFHEVSLALKVSKTKVRNLIYEVELKYRDNHNFIEQLINIIEKGKYEATDEKMKFAVHNPLVKQYFEYESRKLDGVSDGSFAKHIVTISTGKFEKLLLKLYGNSTIADEIISELPKNYQEKITNKNSFKEWFLKNKNIQKVTSENAIQTLGRKKLVLDQYDNVSLNELGLGVVDELFRGDK